MLSACVEADKEESHVEVTIAMNRPFIPFTRERQLYVDGCSSPDPQTFPGWPDILLSDTYRVQQRLRTEVWAAKLEKVANTLWILTTARSDNINPLHAQKVKGREIVVCEDPHLHLVWSSQRIYLKPIPTCLLSHQVWQKFLANEKTAPGSEDDDIRRAALGVLRSYRHLIEHESDLAIAQHQDLQLIPSYVTWPQWSHFRSQLEKIQDRDVSIRFRYGEIRLSRLNLYAPYLFRKTYYTHMPVQYGEYFTRLYGPVLIIFAIASTMLNTMQVALASAPTSEVPAIVGQIFYWFSIVILIAILAILLSSVIWWVWMIVDEWVFTLAHRWRKNKDA